MELIAGLANGFIELFKAGAATFMSWVVNIIPLVVVLMTAVSACIKLIGEEKVYNVAGVLTKSIFTKCERKAPKFIYGDISSLKNNDSISLFFFVLYF